jgi:hypothetical protein
LKSRSSLNGKLIDAVGAVKKASVPTGVFMAKDLPK